MSDSFEVLTSVDIGSHSLKGVVTKIDEGVVEILAFSEVRSRGYENGELKDIIALKESLGELIGDLSNQLPRRMESYFIITYSEKSAFLNKEVKRLRLSEEEPELINEEHVLELYESFSNTQEVMEDITEETGEGFDFINNSRSILHVIPLRYILDETKSVLNPIDMEANVLGMESSIISIDYTEKESMSNAFASLVGEKPMVYLSTFVSSEAVLNSKEKEHGVVCVDLGHSFTTITAYINGSIFFLKAIDQGIKSVIKDIAKVFHSSFDEAERMLINYGRVALKDKSTDTISYVMLDGKTTKQIPRSQLSIVIYAKVREILNFIKKELRTVLNKMAEEGETVIPGGIVITGGGSRIEGMSEFIRDVFKLSVRVGTVNAENLTADIPEDINGNTFSAALGSVYWYKFIGGGETEAVEASQTKRKKKKVANKKVKEGPSFMEKFAKFLKKLV
ncbi:MAG: cell division protein FtsA [Thermotogaceae bacterium]|jgi:cell division protein FtsA|nr:cell division protein FtsA [Thermotogaceae bacterium]